MTQPTVPERTTKRADELAPGDWTAGNASVNFHGLGPVEVLFVKPYTTDLGGERVHLVVAEVGFPGPQTVKAEASERVRLLTDAELAAIRKEGERAQRIAEIREFAAFLESNPWAPIEHFGMQWSPNLSGDVWNSGAEGVAQVRQLAERMGVDVKESDDRTQMNRSFGLIDYCAIAWHKDGRPARPGTTCEEIADPDPTGLTYSREDDDPQVVRPHSPRVPMHVGVREADGGELVDETPVHLDVYGDPIPADQICVASLHIPTPGESCGWCGMQGMRSGQHIEVMAGTENGVASARCACGTTFDGFHSIAEASAELAKHIADATGPVVDPTGRGRESDPDWVAGFGPVPGSDLIGESR